MSVNTPEFLINLKEIAEIVGVSPSAASNWRARKQPIFPFPLPRIETASGSLYDFYEIQEWLLATNRINEPLSPDVLINNVNNALRGYIALDEIPRFLGALLVYLEACKRSANGKSAIQIAPSDRWESISAIQPSERLEAIIRAAKNIEMNNADLQDTMSIGIRLGMRIPSNILDSLFHVVNASWDVERNYVVVLKRVHEWHDSLAGRVSHEQSTPSDLATLMAFIANTRGKKVFDPAVGAGNIFLRMIELGGENSSQVFTGFENNLSTLAECKGLFFLLGIPVELIHRNSLLDMKATEMGADVVVLDPPFGVPLLSNSEVATLQDLPFGMPPKSSSDFAWLQIAYMSLRPGGVALVLSTHSTAFRGGSEGRIRQEMLDAGVVASVISLPTNLRRTTQIATLLWVLRRPSEGEQPGMIQLIDATMLGRPGRRGRDIHQFSEEELKLLSDYVIKHLDGAEIGTQGSLLHALRDPKSLNDGNILQAIKDLNQKPQMDISALRKQQQDILSKLQVSMKNAHDEVDRLYAALKEFS